MISLEDIKTIRNQLGITQAELAYRAKVSQSLIAKIESGLLDPTYGNAKKIFDALSELQGKEKILAKEIMQEKMISVMSSTQINEAIKKMKKHEISQLPVIDKGKCLGLVSESILLDEIIKGSHERKIKDIMKDSPPIVPMNSSVDVVSNLLKFFPMVLVSDSGKIKGLITKSDVISKIYK